ncbi:hypothetical protein HDU67_001926 [Dinochytrium kinnereticum]|nr:hypothetical protein HDU67_001926 [Dinochytrium kinnereticum]
MELPCKFFQLGSCRSGRNCRFSHDRDRGRSELVCTYFAQGNCRFGDSCGRFMSDDNVLTALVLPHRKPDVIKKSTPATKPPPAKPPSNVLNTRVYSENVLSKPMMSGSWAKAGDESNASYNFINGPDGWPSEFYSDIPTTVEAAEQPPPPVSYSAVIAADIEGEPAVETIVLRKAPLCSFALKGLCRFGEKCRAEMECTVCFEKVLDKIDPRFGILSCEHCICLECIRQWRSNERMETAKTCPICRTLTHFVLPSTRWIQDPVKKEIALQAYKDKLSQIDCCHFNFGEGTCPFGTSCMYRHCFPDGTKEEVKLRFMLGDDEDVKVMNKVFLSDFL